MTCGIGTPLSAAEASARRALDRSLPELKFDNITLGDAMDFLRDVSGVNIHVNWRVLEQSGIGRENHKMMLSYYRQSKNMLISYNKNKLGFF